MTGNINWDRPVEWSTGEEARRLSSDYYVTSCDRWLDLTGDEVVVIDQYTGKILGHEEEPDMPFVRNKQSPPVWLHLFHGRDTVEEDMPDWGYDGPWIGPLSYVHVTYMSDVKMALPYAAALEFFPAEAAEHEHYAKINGRSVDEYPVDVHLTTTEGLIEYQGKFYGDFSVNSEPAS